MGWFVNGGQNGMLYYVLGSLSGFGGNSFGSISVSHCTTNIFAQK